MAEDKTETKTLLKDPDAALAAIKRAQEKGSWPKIETTQSPAPPPAKEDTFHPVKKMFETEVEQKRVLESIPAKEETVPPEIKKELTEEARRLNTIAMGQGEGPTETSELPQVEHVEAKGGAEPLRRILKAQETVEKVKRGENVPLSQTESAPEVEVVIPSHDVAPASAPWIKKEQPRMVGGAVKTAVGQVGTEPQTETPPLTPERVAYNQSIAKGQEIKKHWYDRVPFLSILRGERKPAG